MEILQQVSLSLVGEIATEQHAQHIAEKLQPGLVIYLSGELGAGKTAWTRALLHALGHKGRVKSPTYTLVEVYSPSIAPLYHFDLYRMNHQYEWTDAGFDEYVTLNHICLIEWPEKAIDVLPIPDIWLNFEYTSEGLARELTIQTFSIKGQQLLS